MSRLLKLGPRLKELRLHLCQTGEASKGVRDFIEQNYVELKSNNPKFPILIRECSGVQPKLWARFEKGKEVCYPLTNCSASEVLSKIEAVAK